MVTKNDAKRLPKMGRHTSGQARVTISGKVHYLGAYGSLEAQQAYTRLIERWEANGRRPLDVAPTLEQVRSTKAVLAEYLEYLDTTKRYHKDGKPTSARHNCRNAVGEFMKACDTVPVHKLSHVHVLRHRDTLEARSDLSLYGVNLKIRHVLRALRWARERELLTREQALALMEVRSLRASECGGRVEHKRPKRAVTPEEIEMVAAKAPPMVARMLGVQAAIGCRPGELCRMRWCDLATAPVDVDGIACRIYVVAHAKNEHHGKGPTTYALPPSIVALLGTPTAPGAPVFASPFSDHGYHVGAYRNAVALACALAGVSHFSPHEVRHGFLTRAARRYGVLAACAAANHANTTTTAGYLHRDRTEGYRVVVGLAGAKSSAS